MFESTTAVLPEPYNVPLSRTPSVAVKLIARPLAAGGAEDAGAVGAVDSVDDEPPHPTRAAASSARQAAPRAGIADSSPTARLRLPAAHRRTPPARTARDRLAPRR